MTQNQEASTVVYSFPRGENEKIQLELRPYKGKHYIDLRLWFQETPESIFAPTKKGVSFSADSMPELKEGVAQLDLACQKLKEKPAGMANPENKPRTPSQNAYTKRPASAWNQRNSR